MPDYPWYDIKSTSSQLEQGDILLRCPILVPSSPKELDRTMVPSDVLEYDAIVMSQSCDLEQRKLQIVLVCPVSTLDELSQHHSFYASKKGKEKLRRGYVHFHHLLAPCEHEALGTLKGKLMVVDFRSVFGVHIDFLQEFAEIGGDRARLLPPYREHLSQAFARFFMRVGLPVNIPAFK